jgi:hypothetical protein
MRIAHLFAFAAIALTPAGAAHTQSCGQSNGQSFAFTGLNPAIEGKLPLSNFEAGQVVEIDPVTMTADDARVYIKALQDKGARVSIYLVGGHCDKGRDCDALAKKQVKLGSTGSWNWDKTERRILDVTHLAVKERLAKGIVNGFMLGANYIRIDNLHYPAGSTNPRGADEMSQLIDLAQEIEDQMRSDGTIPADRVTGVVAHNNLVVWAGLVDAAKIRRPPALLTSERTAQLASGAGWSGEAKMKSGTLEPTEIAEIEAGRKLARKLNVPYTIAEFRRNHDLARRGKFYPLPQAFAEAAAALDGVTEVIVIPSEDHYIGRGEVFPGNGPKVLAGQAVLGKVSCVQ